MSPGARDHEWASKNLAAFGAGILDDSGAERFERHVESCSECQAELEALRSPEACHGQHLPDRMIARWNRASRQLRGLQRELVRRHLASCDECAAILEKLGHAANLEQIAELEPSRDLVAMLAPRSSTAAVTNGTRTGTPRVIKLPTPSWRTREFWTGSAFGGLIAAAAVAIVFGPMLIGTGQTPGTSPGEVPSHTAIVASPVRLELGSGLALRTLGTLESGDATRGAAGDTTIVLTPDQNRVRVNLAPEPGLTPETQVAVELMDATGRTLWQTSAQYSYLLEADRGLAIGADGPLPEADFVIRLNWTDASGVNHSVHYPVHLRR